MSGNDAPKMLTIRQQIWVSQEIGKWYLKWKKDIVCDTVKRELSMALNELRNILCEIKDYQFNTLEALLQIDQECDKDQNNGAAPEKCTV